MNFIRTDEKKVNAEWLLTPEGPKYFLGGYFTNYMSFNIKSCGFFFFQILSLII